MTMNEVINAFATVNENNEVTAFNFADFDKLVSELYTKRAELRKANKETVKASKEADKEALAKIGKKYYNSLEIDAEFSYKTADGAIVTAKKIATKSGSGSTASCEVISGIEIKTTAKRYPKFHQVIVPADFSVEE